MENAQFLFLLHKGRRMMSRRTETLYISCLVMQFKLRNSSYFAFTSSSDLVMVLHHQRRSDNKSCIKIDPICCGGTFQMIDQLFTSCHSQRTDRSVRWYTIIFDNFLMST